MELRVLHVVRFVHVSYSVALWLISEHFYSHRRNYPLLVDSLYLSVCLHFVFSLHGCHITPLPSWIKIIDQLMSLALFFAQHVSNASTFIFRSLWLRVGILLWFDVCWRYGVVRLGWCGILMQVEALSSEQKIKQVTSVGLSLFDYQDDARSNKHKIPSL